MPIRTGLLLVVAAILLFPYQATAECVIAPPVVFARDATVVFSGTVTKEVETGSARAQRNAQFVSFNVDRVWQGDVRRQFDLYSFTRAFERYLFQVGTRYLVFAHKASDEERADLSLRESEVFVVGQCGSGTLEFQKVSPDELAQLGPGAAPRP